MPPYRLRSLPGAATARVEREAPREVNVPLMRTLMELLEEDRRWVVLDLGGVRPKTLELLNGHRCRLDIANIGDGIEALSDLDESADLADQVRSLLPAVSETPTDITLCWDYLNYCERDVLTLLMAEIAQRSRPGALVHALIVYSEKLMQQQPGEFVLVDEGRILSTASAAPARVAPRYSSEDLSVCLPDFSIEQARLLRNGMQEYLFRRKTLQQLN